MCKWKLPEILFHFNIRKFREEMEWGKQKIPAPDNSGNCTS